MEQEPTGFPARQNRRTALIESALAPARGQFDSSAARRGLRVRLPSLSAPNRWWSSKTCCSSTPGEAAEVKRWAIRALVDAA